MIEKFNFLLTQTLKSLRVRSDKRTTENRYLTTPHPAVELREQDGEMRCVLFYLAELTRRVVLQGFGGCAESTESADRAKRAKRTSLLPQRNTKLALALIKGA
jgi:hypothetical protein